LFLWDFVVILVEMLIRYANFVLQSSKPYGFRFLSSAASAVESTLPEDSAPKKVNERRVSSQIEKLVDEIASLSLLEVTVDFLSSAKC